MSSNHPPIDLSDLDPFHATTPSRTSSPRIFTSPLVSSSNSNSNSSNTSTPAPPPSLPKHPVDKGDDPLDLFASLIDLGSSPARTNAPSGGATGTSSSVNTSLGGGFTAEPGVAAREQVTRAQDARQERVWNDLERDPWGIPGPLSSSTSSSATPHASSSTSSQPIPPRRHPRREGSSSSHHSSSSFSPPRRLSGLMEPTTLSHPISSNPTSSQPPIDLFHPSSPPLPYSAETTLRRRASLDPGPSFRPKNIVPDPSSSPEWSDFQGFSSNPPPPPPSHNNNNNDSAFSFRSDISSSSTSSAPKSINHRPPQPPPKPSQSLPIPRSSRESPLPRTPPPRLDSAQPITLTGVRPGVQQVLTEDVAEGIRPNLPPRLRISHKWSLLYSLDQHGISLQTLYERMRVGLKSVSDKGVVLVVKDERDNVFGAFVNEGFREQKGYYGDGTCFLWKSIPFPTPPPSPPSLTRAPTITSYPWTGRNTYLILSESTYISIGGGDGKFGLWLDGVFEKGFTTSCPAFENDPLNGNGEKGWSKGGDGKLEGKFLVAGLEVWGVGV